MRPAHRIALALCIATAVSTASAQDKGDADRRFQKGVELYKQGDLAAALVEFKKAYEIAPNFRVLYNIAQLYGQVYDHANAIRTYQQYLKEGGDQVPAKRRAEVQAELRKLMVGVAKLNVSGDAPGAEVAVDDAIVGTLPLGEPVLVNAGKHTIMVTRSGQPAVSKVVTVKGGESVGVGFELGGTPAPEPVKATPAAVPMKPAEPAPVSDRKSPEPEPSARGVPWVGWGITAALGVGTIVTTIVAQSSVSDYEDKKNTFGVTKQDLTDSQDKARLWVYMATGLGVATAVAGSLSLYLTLSASPAKRTSLVVGPQTIGVRGAF
jgi:hypothetical protein